ncbi:sulfatase-like hydrolase/transferase [Reichenbachiella agariperforans]|uniref:sulfatase-like hydrolase/transferase n=1 Tax=Reichenbachiella agariperforans TaxID=156994 RepID=UPI001C084DC6|nr:sulfatase-like hydrolase/transferase [Reichenbachiella agariperforans]MBU2912637.1 sulfatase-like hydrolase/transferase [Reichenbachiella agariperforans]
MRYLIGMCLVLMNIVLCAQDRPNFVFILTDDQPYGMMGCTGNEIVQTPNLDQLADEGVLFTNAHVTSAICTPSRVSILLSQYERKHGVNFNSGTSVSDEAWSKSYPMVMRKNGYYTGWVGKNHAPIGQGGYESGVMEESFDYWYAGHGHLGFYPKDRHKIFEDAQSDTQIEIVGEGIEDFLDPNAKKMEGAITFLEQRPKDKPFVLSVCLNLPHGAGTRSMQMRDNDDEIYKSLYRDREIPLPPHYVAKEDIDVPKLPQHLLMADNRQTGYDYVDSPAEVREMYLRQMQAMTGIDRLMGGLRATLKEMNLEENTIIIFTSDHGLFMGEFGLGGKALCYEKTTKVPLIVYNPKAKRKNKGLRLDHLVQSIDIAPTMLSMAHIEAPGSFQGKDLTSTLSGSNDEVRDYVYTENLWSTQFGNPRCEAVQSKEWKYIRYYANHNLPALRKIQTAKELGMSVNEMLYAVHDPDIAMYRQYVEAPLEGEEVVYEELYHLSIDPMETTNLVQDQQCADQLNELRGVWNSEIRKAREEGRAAVYRYTADSQLQSGQSIETK